MSEIAVARVHVYQYNITKCSCGANCITLSERTNAISTSIFCRDLKPKRERVVTICTILILEIYAMSRASRIIVRSMRANYHVVVKSVSFDARSCTDLSVCTLFFVHIILARPIKVWHTARDHVAADTVSNGSVSIYVTTMRMYHVYVCHV